MADQAELAHYGILGMKWGVRRYQNKDGTLTEAGKRRYDTGETSKSTYGREKKISGTAKEGTVRKREKVSTNRPVGQNWTRDSDRKAKADTISSLAKPGLFGIQLPSNAHYTIESTGYFDGQGHTEEENDGLGVGSNTYLHGTAYPSTISGYGHQATLHPEQLFPYHDSAGGGASQGFAPVYDVIAGLHNQTQQEMSNHVLSPHGADTQYQNRKVYEKAAHQLSPGGPNAPYQAYQHSLPVLLSNARDDIIETAAKTYETGKEALESVKDVTATIMGAGREAVDSVLAVGRKAMNEALDTISGWFKKKG